MSKLHEQLKQRRMELGMSLSEAARESGVARSYLYQLERGESQPTIDKLQLIATAYQTTVGALIGETDDALTLKERRIHLILLRAIREISEL